MPTSQYSLVTADITPGMMDADAYTDLLRRPSDGVSPETALVNAIVKAENEFNSHLGGMPTTATVIALCLPHLLYVVVWFLHFRRASQGDYKIPDVITTQYQAALKWAATKGAAHLAAEGTVTPVGTPEIEYDADDPTHTMADLDNL